MRSWHIRSYQQGDQRGDELYKREKREYCKTTSKLSKIDFNLVLLEKAVYNEDENKISIIIADLKELGIEMEVFK